MSDFYRGPSYQVLILLAKRFQRFFRNQPMRNKNSLWRPGLLTDKYEMSNLYRGPSRCFLPSFGSFDQTVSEKIFKNWPIRNKNYLWRQWITTKCALEISRPSYKVSVHLAKGFQRRLKCEK